jgi:hypothetical protein
VPVQGGAPLPFVIVALAAPFRAALDLEQVAALGQVVADPHGQPQHAPALGGQRDQPPAVE